MKIIIAGSRLLESKEDQAQCFRLFGHSDLLKRAMVIMSGKCRGADAHGEAWAGVQGLTVEVYPAQWSTYGRRAGPLRNQQMIDAGARGLVVLTRGASRGSRDMLRRASGAGLAIEHYDLDARRLHRYAAQGSLAI